MFVAVVALLVACGEPRTEPANDPEVETFEIRGDVSGMEVSALGEDDALVLTLNDGLDELRIEENGPFVFSEELEDEDEYEVTIETEPPEHDCAIENASGVIDRAWVTDIEVECEHLEEPPPLEPAYFTVDIDESESELDVIVGDDLEFAAVVENTGEEAGQQNVELFVDGEPRDTASDVELDGGQHEPVVFEFETDVAGPGFYEIEVHTDDDSDSAFGTVRDEDGDAPAYFGVTIDEAASDLEVSETQTVAVSAEVENLGDVQAVQDIRFSVGDAHQDVVDGLLLPGQTPQTVVFEWSTAFGDAGTYTAEVATDDHTATAEITVSALDDEFVTVDIDHAASTLAVEEGDTAEIVADLKNLGADTATQDIVRAGQYRLCRLRIPGGLRRASQRDSRASDRVWRRLRGVRLRGAVEVAIQAYPTRYL